MGDEFQWWYQYQCQYTGIGTAPIPFNWSIYIWPLQFMKYAMSVISSQSVGQKCLCGGEDHFTMKAFLWMKPHLFLKSEYLLNLRNNNDDSRWWWYTKKTNLRSTSRYSLSASSKSLKYDATSAFLSASFWIFEILLTNWMPG